MELTYEKTPWNDKDTISAEKLNKIEDAIYNLTVAVNEILSSQQTTEEEEVPL